MKVYHMGSERNPNDELQVIFVASNDSEGINNMKEVYQITVWKKHKTIEILKCGHRDLNPGRQLGKLMSYQARLRPQTLFAFGPVCFRFA